MNPSESSSAETLFPAHSHAFQDITILGIGLVGGSIAHIVNSLGMVAHVWDPDAETASLARQFNWNVYETAEEAASKGDLVILAGPVDTISDTGRLISPSIRKDAVVTDVGSVKNSISNSFSDIFRNKGIEFIPGHPMAGKATHGLSSADITLFKDATWVFTDSRVSPALPRLVRFAQELGASRFISMDSEEHDILVALISHVPQMIATALASGVSKQKEFGEAVQIAGSGFRDMTRLASSEWGMWGPIISENREALILPLSRVRDVIDEMIRDLLAGQHGQLEAIFAEANKARDSYEKRSTPHFNEQSIDDKLENLVEFDSGKAWLDRSLGYRTIRTTSNTSLGHMRLALLLLGDIRGVAVDDKQLVKGSNMVEQIAKLVNGNYETTYTADGFPVEGVAFSELLYVIP